MAMRAHGCRARRLAAGAVLVACAAAAAGGEQFIPVYEAEVGGPSVPASYDSGASPYTGIGRYEGRGTCTAFFLATALPGQEYLEEAPAYAVTSGRCAANPGADDVLVNLPGSGSIIFKYFADSGRQRVSVLVARIAYATVKGRDLAILELAIPYRELVQKLVRPWRVPHFPQVVPGDLIAVVSAPRTSPAQEDVLRLALCRMEGVAPVVVEHNWQLLDTTLNRCRDVAPASSGAPVLSVIDRYAIGVVSTTTIDADHVTRCALGHPCEPTRGGTRSRRDTNYVTRLAGINACFNDRHRFDARGPGCPLDPGTQAGTTPPSTGAVNRMFDRVLY